MDAERKIMAWITWADMFIISAWPYILLAAFLFIVMLIAWTISDCVIRIQQETGNVTERKKRDED